MIAGDLLRVEEERARDGDGGLELSLGLAVGGRSSYLPSSVTQTSAGEAGSGSVSVSAEAVYTALPLGRTVSGPPDALELQRRREMHAIKRQEARRKLEVKQQMRKGGGSGTSVARGKSSGGCGGAALWRTCSADDRVAMEAQEQRVRERDREAREAEDEQQQQRKGAASGDRQMPLTSKSRSRSTTPSEIPTDNMSKNNTVNDDTHHPLSSTLAPTHPASNVTPYHFPPIMPMPYALHPAQYVHFGAAGYVLPCWSPAQVAPTAGAAAGPGLGTGGETNRGVTVVPPSRGSSFRPFRQGSGNLLGATVLSGGQERNSAKASSAGATGGIKRAASSLSASQGSSFSAISEYQSDPDPLQGGGGASSGGDNTQANSSPEHPAAASGETTLCRRRPPSSSQSTNPPPPAQSADRSVSSSSPTTPQPVQPANDKPHHQHERHPPDTRSASDDNHGTSGLTPTTATPEQAAPSAPMSASTNASTRPPLRPRSLPYVSAKGTGPNSRTVTGFLYKFDDKDNVSIVCVCHGTSFTPAEFVRHAGATDIDNPLRHIVVLEEPPKQRVMVPSA